MKKIHPLAGFLAVSLIAAFFASTVFVEAFGSYEDVATVKRLIVFPGLFILVPAITTTGITGFILSRSRGGRLARVKKKRMPVIALNGVFILVPSAVYLYVLSVSGFGASFYAVQAVELVFGAANIILMGLNIRDGLNLAAQGIKG